MWTLCAFKSIYSSCTSSFLFLSTVLAECGDVVIAVRCQILFGYLAGVVLFSVLFILQAFHPHSQLVAPAHRKKNSFLSLLLKKKMHPGLKTLNDKSSVFFRAWWTSLSVVESSCIFKLTMWQCQCRRLVDFSNKPSRSCLFASASCSERPEAVAWSSESSLKMRKPVCVGQIDMFEGFFFYASASFCRSLHALKVVIES